MVLLLGVGVGLAAACGRGATSGGWPRRAEPERAGSLARFEFTRVQMGVQSRIVLYAANRAEAEAAAAAAFERIGALDAVMSDYRRDSELARLCERAGGEAVPVSRDLFRVLAAARAVSEATGGAFDVTVGPAVALWRRARQTRQLPTEEERLEAMSLIGWQWVVLDRTAGTVRLAQPGMRLDLGGIGKGYAAAEAVETLRARGVGRCLVGLAGDIATGDAPPGRIGWEVEVEVDGAGAGGERMALLLANRSVSTSGSREQFVEIDGRRYSHMVDPRTGLGATTSRVAAVVGKEGAVVDAAATALCVVSDAEREMVRDRLEALGVRLVDVGGGRAGRSGRGEAGG